MTEDYFATKYDSAAAEIIAALADEMEGYGQRDDSTGEADAPTGYVSLVVIPDGADLVSPGGDAYLSDLAATYGVTTADVAGVHIVTTNSQGFVDVSTYDDEATARADFDRIAAAYAEYLGDDED